MDTRIETAPLAAIECELLALTIAKGGALNEVVTALDQALDGAISQLLDDGDIEGKPAESLLFHTRGVVTCKRLLLLGVGPEDAVSPDSWRVAAAAAAQQAKKLGLEAWCMSLHGADESADVAQAVVEGAILGSYSYDALKSEQDDLKSPPTEVLLAVDAGEAAAAQEGAQRGAIIGQATNLARDLVNAPANYMTPSLLAEQAEAVSSEVGLRATILEEREMAELGMGSLLGVAQGADEPAKLIVLEHNADRDDLPTYVVVGKGITFDSGGISLKPSQGMEAMKYDMSGAAATLGIMEAVARLDLPLHVVGIMPATENMPGGRAYHPGDVLRSMSGQTIEVISTDAEGRLILADALTYAARFEPEAVVDMATLTGGCIVALGGVACGLMGNDEDLVAQLEAASKACGQKVWELPLWDEYAEQIKSDVADVKNSGGRPASTIIGGMFLKRFTNDYAWAHLDIAGTAWQLHPMGYRVKGATGVGVRLLVQWLRDRCES